MAKGFELLALPLKKAVLISKRKINAISCLLWSVEWNVYLHGSAWVHREPFQLILDLESFKATSHALALRESVLSGNLLGCALESSKILPGQNPTAFKDLFRIESSPKNRSQRISLNPTIQRGILGFFKENAFFT